MKKKRIILYSGLPKLIKNNLKSIKNTCQIENYHLIFCLWEEDEQSISTINTLKKHFENINFKLIKPRNYLWENITSDFSNFYGDNFLSILYQFDSLQQCMKFAEELIKDDLNQEWCRSRGDLYVKNLKIESIKENEILVPGSKFGIGYTDYFALSGRSSMRIYCNLLDTVIDLLKINILLTPEIVLALHLQRNGVAVKIDQNLPQILLKKSKHKIVKRNNYRSEYSSRLVWNPSQVPLAENYSNNKTFIRSIFDFLKGCRKDILFKFNLR